MARFSIALPDIPYGADDAIRFPVISNTLSTLPDRFYRWGDQSGKPFHCFVDDWRLEAIWRDRYKMADRAVMAGFAIAPDYTVEYDAPLVHAVHQVWRSRVVGRYWQQHGVYVVPVLQWSRSSIHRWLWSGLELSEVVAVRSPTKGFVDQWSRCARQFLLMYQPRLVLHFGTKAGFDVWPNAINLQLKPGK